MNERMTELEVERRRNESMKQHFVCRKSYAWRYGFVFTTAVLHLLVFSVKLHYFEDYLIGDKVLAYGRYSAFTAQPVS
jgi:hypothetical protein